MADQVLYVGNNAKNYSTNLKKLIDTIAEEMSKGIKDGLAFRFSSVENDETKLYAFVKNEGYDITYKEFSGFIADAKEVVLANKDFLESIIGEQMSEQMSEELSDNELEQVAGGTAWWQWLLAAVCAVAVIAAVIVTCGALAPLIPLAATGVLGAGVAVGTFVGTAGGLVMAGAASTLVVAGVTAAVGVTGVVANLTS